MPLVRKFIAEEIALAKLTWALLAAVAVVGAIMYFPQLSFILDGLRHLGAWLGTGAF